MLTITYVWLGEEIHWKIHEKGNPHNIITGGYAKTEARAKVEAERAKAEIEESLTKSKETK